MTETEALAALNALHSPDPDGWKPGTPTDYMTCKGCDVLTLGGGSRRLWKDCPTRAILARVGSGAVPPPDIDRAALEDIADLHLATGAGWKDDGREGFVASVRAILAGRAPAAIDRTALIDLLADETGWTWEGEQDEPAPDFGCDTRVPSSAQALAAFADRILALVRPVEGVDRASVAAEFVADVRRRRPDAGTWNRTIQEVLDEWRTP